MAKRKRITKKARSLAAKKGWRNRRRKEREQRKAWEESGSPIVEWLGPHKRQGLTKDFDDLSDFARLAQTAKEDISGIKEYSFAFKLRFIPDVNNPDEYSERWVSIPFNKSLHKQTINARDYLENLTSGRLNYGLVVPIQTAIMVHT